jgi:hypothetical protein
MFNWSKDAELAAKLIIGSKKLMLLSAYALLVYKAMPHLAHWVSVKVAPFIDLFN